MAQSEQEQFLSDLEPDLKADPFEAPLEVETPEKEEEVETTETEEQKEEKRDNRRYRRLEKKYQEEREMGIALNARLQALSETHKFQSEVGDDPLREVEAIFGTDTPEKLAATNILKKSLEGMSELAQRKAIEHFESQLGNETKALRESEQTLDDMMESLEEDYDADFSNPATRKGFLTLLERISPKDKDGNIIEYADAATVYELYESRKEKPSTKAKELASRSMTRSGSSSESKLVDDATERYLRENDLI